MSIAELQQHVGKRYRDGQGLVWTIEDGFHAHDFHRVRELHDDPDYKQAGVPMTADELSAWLKTAEPVGQDFYLVTYQTMLTPASSPRTHNVAINMCPGAYWAEALVTLRKSKMHGSTFLQATPITEESYEALRKVQL